MAMDEEMKDVVAEAATPAAAVGLAMAPAPAPAIGTIAKRCLALSVGFFGCLLGEVGGCF